MIMFMQQGRLDGHILHIIPFCLIEHIITRNVIAAAEMARHCNNGRFECQVPHVDMSELCVYVHSIFKLNIIRRINVCRTFLHE